MLARKDMRVYQRRAVKFIKDHPESGLFLDMGLGKTVSTLTALNDLIGKGEVERVLLVGPLRVVQGVWRQEARKWEHLRGLTFKLIHGDEEQRLLAMNSKAQIHLINVENLRWLIFVLRHLSRRKGFVWPYDTLLIDESSMFKTAGTKRMTTIKSVLKHFRRRHILTGTPAPNGILDIWSQMYIVDQGLRLGENIKRYKGRFFGPSYDGYGVDPLPGAREKVAELISPVILTMRSEDWLELPPLIKSEVWVDLPPAARKLYDKMEREMFLELDMGTAEATHAATLSNKCHQIANGALFLQDANQQKVWQAVHDAKLQALDEVLEGTGSNALVAYYFKPDLERLRKKYPDAPCIKDAKNARQLELLQNDWNAGKHRIMFVHPQGAGHGLNLQHGGNLLIFYSLLFGHEPYRQVIERIGPARQVGLVKRVLVKHILARDTVDEALLAAQVRKFDDERGFVRSLKEYREIRELLG